MRKQNPFLIGVGAFVVLYLVLLLVMGGDHWQQALVIEVLAAITVFLLYRGKIKAIFTIPELRQKILLTLLFLAIYRIGFAIPLPFVDQTKMTAAMGAGGALGNVLNFVSMFSGGNLSHATVFGLGIMPYISASIIFQLLAAVYPPLEKLQKEGESGRKKINEYTRYATVLICLFQAFMYVQYIMGPASQGKQGWALTNYDGGIYWATMIMTLTCGTIFLMWLGEQIDEYGIGNGISLIIMAGIIARMPAAASTLFFENGHFKESVFTLGGGGGGRDMSFEKLIVLVVLFVTVVVGVVAITKAQRRIKTQSAKHVRGRRVFGGTSQWLPLRVNQAGVMPVIFASSLLVLPYFLFGALAQGTEWRWAQVLQQTFERQGYWYTIMFIALIYVFCYFWTAIIFNPKDMANNLKDYGSFIPGYRPGKRTAEYLERVMVRITYVGAAFLAVIAVIPTLITNTMNVDPNVASFYGGTGLLIVISVALDLVQKINSHLVMRNYPGLTED
ncbi:MAG TPA: preprotein translocase subunit SecY [Gemmataceae bacterium]|nr:preprotein translocase subunit SecY [Gemmataceae bacterium]